ncbi:MAG: hypothetical protein ACI9EW_002510 [Cellvibrionaceae bacterium]|jgi:hypothetical protein
MKQINSISRNTIIIGVLLMLVGLLGRILSGTTSITAFIPLFFGLPIAVLGWFSQFPKRAKVMHIIVSVLAALGVFGTNGAITDVLAGSELSAALLSRSAMLVLCIILLSQNLRWLFKPGQS